MDLSKLQKLTRRKFLIGLASAAVWSAGFHLVYGKKSTLKSHNDKVYLAAACGTFCGACPAYLARHGEDEQMRMKRLSPEPKNARDQ